MFDTTIVDESGAPQDSSDLCVLVLSPTGFTPYPLPTIGEVVVGRSEEVDIRVSDRRVSRRHAVLRVSEVVTIEDLHSGNGTRVRGSPVTAGVPVSVNLGDAIVIGGTCLIVERQGSPAALTGVWSHTTFEARANDVCALARAEGREFSIGRIRVDTPAPWTDVAPVLVKAIAFPHLLAVYGSSEYELLLRDVTAREAEGLAAEAVARLANLGMRARWALAAFPADGRSADELMQRATDRLRALVPGARSPAVTVSPEPAMRRLYEMAARAAAGNINVLVLGETGVGKEILAQSIHQLSPRRERELLCLNCAAINETLLESELFGHEKGAFTGASAAKPGLLETAQGGTIFLDELGELPLSVQAKLLRVIDRREVIRLGGLRPRAIDVRFVSATNRDLEAECDRGAFRRDLLFRLNGICLEIPPLRERRAEIPELVVNFLAGAAQSLGRERPHTISARAMRALCAYHWPGNIRELRNVIDRAAVLADDEIEPMHLPLQKMRIADAERSASTADDAVPSTSTPADAGKCVQLEPRRAAERQRIIDALSTCAGNQSRAAELLGIPRRTFVEKLRTYGIPRPHRGP